jgi:hypothetical protein
MEDAGGFGVADEGDVGSAERIYGGGGGISGADAAGDGGGYC